VLETHAVLHDLYVPRPGSLSGEASVFIQAWLTDVSPGRDLAPLASAVMQKLVAMGSADLGSALELEGGYFFHRKAAGVDPMAIVVVASEVRWVHGAPGLLIEPLPSGRYRCRDVGLLVGPVPPQPRASFEIE
jgi:hypothetical protein